MEPYITRLRERGIDAFALPQRKELTTEGIGADSSHVGCARTEPRRGDRAVRRVAAEAMQVFVAQLSRLVEFDQRFAERNQVEAHERHRRAVNAAHAAANCAAIVRTLSTDAPGL